MKSLFPYGLDAPPVVRNLLLCSLACWLLFALSYKHWLPITIHGLQWPALSLGMGAIVMIWSSRYGKLRRREKLLDQLQWRGNERVLDIGCGRGLLAVAAARRVPQGHVTGIDIWQSEDLSDNGPDAVAVNASREGVADRVDTRTTDMRELPFADGTIDIVVSAWAIHNIYQEEGRDRAVGEIARVLRPGGQVMIDDIRHVSRYAERLRAAGFEVALARGVHGWFWQILSLGNLVPGTLVGRKMSNG
jgi:arsenite methyltransferase